MNRICKECGLEQEGVICIACAGETLREDDFEEYMKRMTEEEGGKTDEEGKDE